MRGKIAHLLGCGITTVKHHLRQFGLMKGGRGKSIHKEKLPFGKQIVGHSLQTHKGEVQNIEAMRRMCLEEDLGPVAIACILDNFPVQLFSISTS